MSAVKGNIVISPTEKSLTVTASEENIFSTPSGKSDLVLLVEEKRLHVNKAVLSYASPVFERMFEGDFKEKSMQEIALPGKKYEEFLQLLLCVFPSAKDHPVTRDNLDCVLSLADEYGMEFIKQRCEKFILNHFQLKQTEFQNPDNKELVHFLYLSDKYGLTSALDTCMEKAVRRDFEGVAGLKSIHEFSLLSLASRYSIVSKRMALLEVPAKAVYQTCVTHRITDLFDQGVNTECTDPFSCSGRTGKAEFCIGCRDDSKSHFHTLSKAVDKLAPCFTQEHR